MIVDDHVRTFIAVELPDEVKDALSKVEARIARRVSAALGADAADKAIKWVDPRGVHVTMKFLGAVPASRLSLIERSLYRAVGNVQQLHIEVADLGAFPNPRRPRVLWVGLRGDLEELEKLHSLVDAEMARLGFHAEARPFSPHITLARLRETASPEERQKIGEVLEADSGPVPVPVHVGAISLMRSELSRAGARYTRLAHFPLATE